MAHRKVVSPHLTERTAIKARLKYERWQRTVQEQGVGADAALAQLAKKGLTATTPLNARPERKRRFKWAVTTG